MRRTFTKHWVITVAVACIVLCSSLAVGAAFGSAASTDGAAGVTATAALGTADENLSVGDLSAPNRVQLGEAYTVTATIRNDGEFTVREVAYRIVGNVVAAKFVQLPANTTQTVTFEISGNNITGFPQGTYMHGVFTGDARATGNLTLASSAETTTEELTTATTEATTTTVEPTTTVEQTTTTEEQTTTVGPRTTTTETATAAEDASSTARTLQMDVRMENGTLSVTVTGDQSDSEARAVVVRDGELDWEGLQTLVELLLDENAQQNVTSEGIEIDRP